MSGLITLTTDFGLADEYVGVMKGVIFGLAPATQIIDLSHGIEPQNIVQAACVIENGSRYFPENTVHIVVVDPGVGGPRKLVLVGARNQLFLAPDNGVLSLLLAPDEFQFAHAITNEDLYRKPVSRTFHGRDILAPVAVHLATGIPVEKVGPRVERKELKLIDLAPCLSEDGKVITGKVIQIDRFGNLLTNIDRQIAQQIGTDNPDVEVTVTIGNRRINRIATCYENVPPGEVLALFGSRNSLEIAINQGNAKKHLGIATGEIVQLRTNQKSTFTG